MKRQMVITETPPQPPNRMVVGAPRGNMESRPPQNRRRSYRYVSRYTNGQVFQYFTFFGQGQVIFNRLRDAQVEFCFGLSNQFFFNGLCGLVIRYRRQQHDWIRSPGRARRSFCFSFLIKDCSGLDELIVPLPSFSGIRA